MAKILNVLIITYAVCVNLAISQDRIFYKSNAILVEVEQLQFSLNCYIYGDSDEINRQLRYLPSNTINVSDKEIRDVISRCPTSVNEDSFEHRNRHKRAFNIIYPGTKWCGSGNISANYSDLGEYRQTDSCCRTHDHCPDYMKAFGYKYGLTNWSPFQKFHCDCEDELYNCLKHSSDEIASNIGKIYFNVLERNCYKLQTKKTCKQKGWWFTCKKYGYSQVMVFVSNKNF